jgi:hypothetical protein
MATYELQLKKGGVLIAKQWSPGLRNYVETNVDLDDLTFFLGSTVCLESGLALRDVFLFMAKDIEKFSIITYCPFLKDVIAEGLAKPVKYDELNEISLVGVRKVCYFEEEDGERYFHKYVEFCGFGNGQRYGVEFIPANVLSSFPVFIDENVEIVDENLDALFKCMEKFTLVEFLSGIVYELSFFGAVNSRELAMDRVKDSLKEIEKGSFFSLDEVKKKLEEDILCGKVPCKICGEDARSAHFDKPNDICFKCLRKMKEN